MEFHSASKKRLGFALRLIVFPTGLRLKEPNDKLSHQVAQLLLSQTPARYRLASGIYTTVNKENFVGLIDNVLGKVIASESTEKKLQNAINKGEVKGRTREEQLKMALANHILVRSEIELLQKVTSLSQSIIAVDDFAPEWFLCSDRIPA